MLFISPQMKIKTARVTKMKDDSDIKSYDILDNTKFFAYSYYS